MNSPFFTAFTDVAWAALLADRAEDDDLAQAHRLADSALALAVEGGFGGVERDARAVLLRL